MPTITGLCGFVCLFTHGISFNLYNNLTSRDRCKPHLLEEKAGAQKGEFSQVTELSGW